MPARTHRHRPPLTLIAGNASPAAAQDADREAQRAEFLERLEEVRSRLDLTDEQVEQVTPILRASFEALREVLQKHGIDPRGGSRGAGRLGLRGLRNLQRDVAPVREQVLEDLGEVLTDEQLEIYKEIQEENRQAMRQRLRERR